jgi:PEP-CTERM motif
MRVSIAFATVAVAALTWSAAEAASVTVPFPAAGDGWLEFKSGASGFLTPGGYTGELKSKGSFITSYSAPPTLKNFVATGVSGTMNIISNQYATIDIAVGASTVQYFINACCGQESVAFPELALPTPTPLSPLSFFSYTLAADIGQTNHDTGNWIQFGEGSITLYGNYAAPEPSTWAMVGIGFVGLGFVARRGRKPALTAA